MTTPEHCQHMGGDSRVVGVDVQGEAEATGGRPQDLLKHSRQAAATQDDIHISR
jgi:hypothetical protein